jgi:hypothetical protein
MEGHTAFKLRDHFRPSKEPFHEIYMGRNQDEVFFPAYWDYRKYLQSLHIVWQRIREECNSVGEYHTQEVSIPPETPFSQEHLLLINRREATLNVLELDFEAFIVLAKRFMDKAGLLAEKLIAIPKGIMPGNSFTDHKKFFLKYPDIQPNYTKYLEDMTYWYEQELLLWRDKIFSHGKTMVTSMGVSIHKGVIFRPMDRFGSLKDMNKKIFFPMKSKYERLYSLKVTNNDYEMLNDFYQQIRTGGVKLETPDLDHLGDIVSSSGGIEITEESIESIADHLEDFTRDVIALLRVNK